MRRFALSRFRVAALAFAVASAGLALTTFAAPSDSGGGAAAPVHKTGLFSLILGNMDPIFFTIVALSIAGLTLIIQGFIKNRQTVMMPEGSTEQIREMINQRKFKELLEYTRADPSFISKVLHPALNRAPAFNAMKEAMETAIGEQTAEKFRSIEYLNIIGNLGPLLGLLGTVLGMIYAFAAVKDAGGEANVGELSLGISKALCHTFLGLMLAVPCLAAFGVLRTMVDRLTVRGALLAEELLLLIKPQQDTAKPAAGARSVAHPQPAIPGAPIRKAPPMPTPMPPAAPAI